MQGEASWQRQPNFLLVPIFPLLSLSHSFMGSWMGGEKAAPDDAPIKSEEAKERERRDQ